jgi:hypothetical protein
MSDPHFVSFDSFEAMQEYMDSAERKANDRVTDLQRTIHPGDFVVRPIEVGGVPTLIVGKTYSVDQLVESERNAGAVLEELEYITASYKQRIGRGYLFGRWYSVLERDGEYGDAHISTLLPVKETDYHDFLILIRDGKDPFALWAIRLQIEGEDDGTGDDPGSESPSGS